MKTEIREYFFIQLYCHTVLSILLPVFERIGIKLESYSVLGHLINYVNFCLNFLFSLWLEVRF